MAKAVTETKTKTATKKANAKSTKEVKADKPKRPPSAYNMYMKDHLSAWRSDHPGSTVKDAMAAIAAQWRDAPENPNRGKAPAARKPKADKEKENVKAAAKPRSKAKKEVPVSDDEDDAEGVATSDD